MENQKERSERKKREMQGRSEMDEWKGAQRTRRKYDCKRGRDVGTGFNLDGILKYKHSRIIKNMSSQEMHNSEAYGAQNGLKPEQQESTKPLDFSKNANGILTTHMQSASDLVPKEESPVEESISHKVEKDLNSRGKTKIHKKLFADTPDTFQPLQRKTQHSALESYSLTLEYMLIEQLQKNRVLQRQFECRFNALAGLLVQSGVALSVIQEILEAQEPFELIPPQNTLLKESQKSLKLLRPLDKVLEIPPLLPESPELQSTIMQEILAEEPDEYDQAQGYLEFLRAKVLDIPVPPHLHSTFTNFKEKYELVKQREIKRKMLQNQSALDLGQKLENKSHFGEQSASGKTPDNLSKSVKGRKALQMPLKRSSSKQVRNNQRKPINQKEAGTAREGGSSQTQRKRAELKKNGPPSEKKQRGRKKQQNVGYEKAKDGNSFKVNHNERLLQQMMLNDPRYLQQYGAPVLSNPVMGQFGASSVIDPSFSLASPGNGNLHLAGHGGPLMYLSQDQKYFEQTRMLGKRSSQSSGLDGKEEPLIKHDPNL